MRNDVIDFARYDVGNRCDSISAMLQQIRICTTFWRQLCCQGKLQAALSVLLLIIRLLPFFDPGECMYIISNSRVSQTGPTLESFQRSFKLTFIF